MKEFFGFGGFQRPAEGFLSWQHLVFVTSLVVIMVALAVYLGLRNRHRSDGAKNKVLIVSAIAIDVIELFKIVLFCVRAQNPLNWLYDLPLFLCSIMLIAMPLAAFSKGKLQEASLDFVFVFGLLGALAGTYGAGNIYSCCPVLSFDTVVSGVTHTLSGFASLYIGVAGMASMKKKNMPVTFGILTAFCVVAYIVNVLIDYNYMFLMRGDGTPYDIFFNLVGGHPVFYPLTVVLLFFAYIALFYYVYFLCTRKKNGAEN